MLTSIELTEEHKSKLLEMCNKLFPEYKEIILTKQKFLNFGFKDHISYTSRIGNMSIHWFEFCMTHLIPKFEKQGIHINYWLMTLGPKHIHWPVNFNHPVDYLYQEFKKINHV